MVEVHFLGPIPKDPIKLDIKNLSELSSFLKKDPSLKEWLNISAVAVNDEIIKDKNFEFKDGDVITLLPPVCGG